MKSLIQRPTKDSRKRISKDPHWTTPTNGWGCCLVPKSCLTLCDPMDWSLPDFSVHGISPARILGWVAISFLGDLPGPGIEPVSPAWHTESLPIQILGSDSLLIQMGSLQLQNNKNKKDPKWFSGCVSIGERPHARNHNWITLEISTATLEFRSIKVFHILWKKMISNQKNLS